MIATNLILGTCRAVAVAAFLFVLFNLLADSVPELPAPPAPSCDCRNHADCVDEYFPGNAWRHYSNAGTSANSNVGHLIRCGKWADRQVCCIPSPPPTKEDS